MNPDKLLDEEKAIENEIESLEPVSEDKKEKIDRSV